MSSTQITFERFEEQRAGSTAARVEAKIEELEHPWRSREVLEYCYVEEEESTYEVAADVGCGATTVLRNMRKNDIETRDPAEAMREARRVERATYDIDKDGYPRWSAREPDGSKSTVRVHQLLACLDHDPHEVFSDENHVHHRSGDPAMNLTGGYVDVLSRSEHQLIHEHGEWEYDGRGFPVLERSEGDGFSTLSANRHETEA